MIQSCRRIGGGWVAGVAMCVFTASALAQLPSEITRASRPLTSQQRQTVAQYAGDGLKGLRSPQPATANGARQSLLAPLRADASRQFRQAYSDELADKLADLARDQDVPLASRLGAVNILGALAADDGLKALGKTLASDEPAVRYVSATALERSMRRAGTGAHAFLNLPEAEKTLAKMIVEAASAESNADVCRAIVQAAGAIPTAGTSVDAVAEAMLAQLRAVAAKPLAARVEPLRIGLERMQKRYVVELFNHPSVAKHERLMVQAAAGTLLVVVEHVNAQPQMQNDERDRYAGIAMTAENLLNLLTRQNKAQTHVANAIAAGRFSDAASSMNTLWLSPQGPIYSNGAWGLRAGSIEELIKP